MKTAKLVKKINERQSLYECTPPLETWDFADGGPYQFVVASENNEESQAAQGCPEVYLFGANETGEIIDWVELPGSMKHTREHASVFRNAGYVVETPK